MIRSHISSTQECGMVLKFERFSHLLGRSFGVGSPIGLEVLSEGHVQNMLIFKKIKYGKYYIHKFRVI